MTKLTCYIHRCEEPAYGLNLCRMHYTRQLRHGDPLHRVRGGREWLYDEDPWNVVFGFRHAVRASGCWEWTGGYTNPAGYGTITIPGEPQKYAHRASYEIEVGPIPDGMTVDHICFNPPCIRPSHLQLLSLSANASRHMVSTLPTCVRGHVYDADTTYIRSRNGGRQRQCMACQRENQAVYRAKARAARVRSET